MFFPVSLPESLESMGFYPCPPLLQVSETFRIGGQKVLVPGRPLIGATGRRHIISLSLVVRVAARESLIPRTRIGDVNGLPDFPALQPNVVRIHHAKLDIIPGAVGVGRIVIEFSVPFLREVLGKT